MCSLPREVSFARKIDASLIDVSYFMCRSCTKCTNRTRLNARILLTVGLETRIVVVRDLERVAAESFVILLRAGPSRSRPGARQRLRFCQAATNVLTSSSDKWTCLDEILGHVH